MSQIKKIHTMNVYLFKNRIQVSTVDDVQTHEDITTPEVNRAKR